MTTNSGVAFTLPPVDGAGKSNYTSMKTSMSTGALLPSASSTSLGSTGSGNMKGRIVSLEESVVYQSQVNEETGNQMDNLDENTIDLGKNLKSIMHDNKDRADDTLNALRKEFNHRFDLQTAENQRMQQHVTSLKADNARLHRKLIRTVRRIRTVETEMTGVDGGPTDDEEEKAEKELYGS